MASVPPVFRINREDIPNAPEWIDALISPLNLFMQSVWTSLNGSLNLSQNIISQVKTLTFNTGSGYISGNASTWTPFSYKSTLPGQTQFLMIGHLQIASTQAQTVVNPYNLAWHDTNGTVTIDFVSGLAANTSYQMTLLAFYN